MGRSLMREERRAALEAQSHGDAPETPSYPESFDARPGYDNAQGGFPEQPASYDRQPPYEEPRQPSYEEQQRSYEEQQQPSYEEPRQPTYEEQQRSYEEQQQPSYDESYYAPNGGLPQRDAFSTNGGYPEPSYPEPVQEEPAPTRGAAPEAFSAFDEQSYQDDWPQPNGYRNGYPDQYAPEAESAQAGDVSERDRVGFERPGPTSSVAHTLTDAGLPRRGSTTSGANGSGGARHTPQEPSTPTPESNGTDSWRSSNDARWQQASQLRKPKAGGASLLRSAAAGTQGQPGRGSRRVHPAGGPTGLPRSRGRPGQAEQPAPRGRAGTQRKQRNERPGHWESTRWS
ncbi:Signal transduction histidine-protein kinase/phosphatase MprB OS=Streptomyces alboniger OX=132473 GN=CP975_25535 PE=4 SV=1 [Streptomyces alboniger]